MPHIEDDKNPQCFTQVFTFNIDQTLFENKPLSHLNIYSFLSSVHPERVMN
jgi:hypothetical protein